MSDSPANRPTAPESELRLVDLAEQSPDFFWIATTDPCRLLYVSPAYADLWGRPVSELMANPEMWFETIHPEDRDRVERASRELPSSGRFDELFRVVRPDGSMRWVRDRGFAISQGPGLQPRLCGYASDVTDFQRASESSRILASAVEQARDSIVITTTDTESSGTLIIYANSAFTTLTGYRQSEVVGRSHHLLEGPRSDPVVLERLRCQLAGAESFTGELVTYRSDGSPFLAHWEVVPVVDEHGRATHSVITLRDITARKRAQAELLEAKALAEAADHSKSAFLASMSHELRTPLNAIIGFSELLADRAVGALTERQEKYVQNVLAAGRSLLDLIDQVLDLTRVDIGRMVLNPTRFSIADLFSDVHSLVRSLADKKHLSLRIDVPEDFPAVRADARKVKQIVYNLLSNVIRSASEAGTLGMSARTLSEEGEEWFEILISRAGPAAAQEVALTEADPSALLYGADHPHSGLGLALSRKLVDLHGGRITADPRSDGGIVYRVCLPLAGALRPSAPTEVPIREGSASGPLVLVVEDNPDASDLLSLYLSEAGYSVARAFTGEEAVLRARQLRPIAITMDSELPDVSGLDVMATLKKFPETRGIPAVVVSVVDRRATPVVGGVSAWLVKPIDRNQFLSVLHRAIHGSDSPESSPAAMAPEKYSP